MAERSGFKKAKAEAPVIIAQDQILKKKSHKAQIVTISEGPERLLRLRWSETTKHNCI